jgi:GNAT superfamily N-acetyltransferase
MIRSKKQLDAFMKSDKDDRLEFRDGQISLMDEGDQVKNLHSFSVLKPGKGTGSHIMKMICKYADKNNVTLTLFAGPGYHMYLNLSSLVSFYKRHGFVLDKLPCDGFSRYPTLTRVPKQF